MDISLIEEYIRSNYDGIKLVVLTKKIEMHIWGIIKYAFHIMNQAYQLSTSKIILIDGYCVVVSLLKHKRKTQVIQMWHALGAIKKFGFQSVGKPLGHNKKITKVMHMHENYDFVLCASNATGYYFSEAFNTDMSKIKYLGLPRIDYLMQDDKKIVDEINRFYDIDKSKEIILYAPTFRKNASIELESLLSIFNFEQVTLVIKLHPLDIANIYDYINGIDFKGSVIIDDRYNTFQWLNVCDKIITDYSSLGIEAALKNKPLYFYIYDYEEYEKNIGLNIKLKNEFSKYAIEEAEVLKRVIKENYDFDILEKFVNKYVTVLKDNCTKQIAEFIIELMEKN